MTSEARDRRLRPLADMSIIISAYDDNDEECGYVDYSLISAQ